MSTDISNILRNRGFEAPPEIQIIKDFIQQKFKAETEVNLGPRAIVIVVDNGSLAGALRMQLHELAKLLKTDKKLVIRIK